jgi:hypothetical protein
MNIQRYMTLTTSSTFTQFQSKIRTLTKIDSNVRI